MDEVSYINITPFGETRYVDDHDDKHHDRFTYSISCLDCDVTQVFFVVDAATGGLQQRLATVFVIQARTMRGSNASVGLSTG